MQEVTVYLRRRREPVKFLAQEFDVKLDLRSRGVQELSYEAPGGRTVRVYLDPREIVAMVPRPVAGKQPRPAKAGTELAKERRPRDRACAGGRVRERAPRRTPGGLRGGLWAVFHDRMAYSPEEFSETVREDDPGLVEAASASASRSGDQA